MKDLHCESNFPKESAASILKAYKDRIFKLTLKESFLLLYEMRFCSKRIYHTDGRVTLELDAETADKLEKVFEGS